MSYSKIHKCGLCEKMFAVLPVTIHYSSAYHPKYCGECGKLIENMINLLKKNMKRAGWK